MKYTKVFFGNQYVNRFYCGRLTKWQRFCRAFGKYSKRTIIVGGIVASIGWAYVFGTMTKLASADSLVSTSTPVIMQRIAQCESGDSQYNKAGQLLVNINENGTYDVGMYQINSVWNGQASKLGYDLTKQHDNQAFALWLYANKGTGEWSSSSKCWQ